MALYYFDTSALVKYYVPEPGSAWVRHIIEGHDPATRRPLHLIHVGEITRVEVAAGLAIVQRTGRVTRAERDREYRRFVSHLTHRYAVIPLTTSDLESAAGLTQRYPLKAYDAVQLAVVLRYHQALAGHRLALAFVSGDSALVGAAKSEGLPTENPFDHTAPEDMPATSQLRD
jgi:predicted nucleic acid-binding protein